MFCRGCIPVIRVTCGVVDIENLNVDIGNRVASFVLFHMLQ